MKKENTKQKPKHIPNPINLSARFLAARPDFVGAWIIGAHSLLPIFKSKHKEAITAYLETVQGQFFAALRHHFEKKHPNQKLTYTFGTICRNRKGFERLIIGITPTEKGKPTYDYIDDDGKVGACNESSMVGWMEKN
jgi:hypothetical protein